MSIWLYESTTDGPDQLILWDGENTYWSEEMWPSAGYTCDTMRFVYVGEL